uniref:Uncharacterized protein n=1 Tax=Wolbachia endosymbiont of Aleurodicus floccissimus TaxID=2152762 RepID=A0A3B0JEN1_9RICK
MRKNEKVVVNGVDGKDADFAALAGDAIKKGEIVEEEVDGNKQLSLKLSATDYKALTQDKTADDVITLNVFLTGKSVEVKFKHVTAANDNDNYKVELTSVDSEDQLADMKEKLSMNDSNPLKVAVSDKGLEALKNEVSAKLGEVAVNVALSKIAGSKQF